MGGVRRRKASWRVNRPKGRFRYRLPTVPLKHSLSCPGARAVNYDLTPYDIGMKAIVPADQPFAPGVTAPSLPALQRYPHGGEPERGPGLRHFF